MSRYDIIRLYRRLHLAGVVHGDVEPRHIRLRNPDAQGSSATYKYAVIDFDHGLVGATEEEIWEERRKVLDMLAVSDDVW